MALQKEGTFTVTLELRDLNDQFANYPIIIEVFCVPGNLSPLCTGEEDGDETGFFEDQPAEFDDDGELITATPQTDSKSAIDEFFDYEPTPVLTIEQQSGKPDPELEDEDDFEDVPGVVSQE